MSMNLDQEDSEEYNIIDDTEKDKDWQQIKNKLAQKYELLNDSDPQFNYMEQQADFQLDLNPDSTETRVKAENKFRNSVEFQQKQQFVVEQFQEQK